MRAALEVSVLDRVPADLHERLPGPWLYHTPAWHRVLGDGMGLNVGAIVVREAGAVVGWLPVVRKRRLARRVHVALPLSHLVEWVLDRPDLLGRLDPADLPRPLEIHSTAPIPGAARVSHHVLTTRDLEGLDSEADVLRGFNSNNRRNVRKGRRAGVSARTRTDAAAFELAHRLHVLTRQRQRAPTYPRRFFLALHRHLGEHCRAHVASVRHAPAAIVITLQHGTRTLYGYGASDEQPDHRKLGVNPIAMHEAIRSAWSHGTTVFDFGSSPADQSGLVRYKEALGGTTRALVHTTVSRSGQSVDVDQGGRLAQLGGQVLDRLPRSAFERLSPLLLKAVL